MNKFLSYIVIILFFCSGVSFCEHSSGLDIKSSSVYKKSSEDAFKDAEKVCNIIKKYISDYKCEDLNHRVLRELIDPGKPNVLAKKEFDEKSGKIFYSHMGCQSYSNEFKTSLTPHICDGMSGVAYGTYFTERLMVAELYGKCRIGGPGVIVKLKFHPDAKIAKIRHIKNVNKVLCEMLPEAKELDASVVTAILGYDACYNEHIFLINGEYLIFNREKVWLCSEDIIL